MSRTQEVVLLSVFGFIIGWLAGCRKPVDTPMCIEPDVAVQHGNTYACVPPAEIQKGKP